MHLYVSNCHYISAKPTLGFSYFSQESQFIHTFIDTFALRHFHICKLTRFFQYLSVFCWLIIGKVDKGILRNAECGKLTASNLRNISKDIFRKLPVVNFPHSAKYPYPRKVATAELQCQTSEFRSLRNSCKVPAPD